MANRKDNPEDVRSEVISMKVTKRLISRINECAKRTKQSRSSIAEQALEAAVDAIEANNYRLVVPIEFDVRHVPAIARPDERKNKTA